ncbi:DNA-directed RNA polymerase subunit beta', partial [Candidatus Bathyarchaeota archaeon]|nr:DNA-directed RNA polymerase subunit beta' [Candidatus Bathyarchaeota archaeon]NIR14872.1 DNA-directed RNA polymerase subunit beta' [Desulfobacterales bacterium]NIW34912.1 DNA-directed RNA polymerase subunit beta' [Candidatus Bathyarchaeota archaeon]
KLLKRRQDVSGTAVVGPEPKLDMDTIGIPENMAWEVFKPFVVKELKSQGLTSMKARKEIEERSKFARGALTSVMDKKIVMANRAPTLHRWSFMSFKPKLVSGSAVKLPVEVLGGFNADFDGDTFGIHVPVGTEATQEAMR